MYLFVYADGSARQVIDNLSVADLLAVSVGTLRIFTYNFGDSKFYKVVLDENKLCKVPVLDSRVIQCEEGRLHHK